MGTLPQRLAGLLPSTVLGQLQQPHGAWVPPGGIPLGAGSRGSCRHRRQGRQRAESARKLLFVWSGA